MELYNSDFPKYRDVILASKIFNGIGPANSWATKLFKLFLKLIFKKDRSLFYEAGIRHDFNYFIGNTRRERRIADWQFLIDMISLTFTKLKNPAKWTWYFLWAFLLFLAVRIGGRFFYNFKKKMTTNDLSLKIARR